eukprot:4030-Eustigmatos_ZCMA.PRE.1
MRGRGNWARSSGTGCGAPRTRCSSSRATISSNRTTLYVQNAMQLGGAKAAVRRMTDAVSDPR